MPVMKTVIRLSRKYFFRQSLQFCRSSGRNLCPQSSRFGHCGRHSGYGRQRAGVDSVAVDTVVADMMGFTEQPRTIELAAEKGFGTNDLAKITIHGELAVIPGFKLPNAGPGVSMESVTALRPNGYPTVDPEKCITCYCCQELCPRKRSN